MASKIIKIPTKLTPTRKTVRLVKLRTVKLDNNDPTKFETPMKTVCWLAVMELLPPFFAISPKIIADKVFKTAIPAVLKATNM